MDDNDHESGFKQLNVNEIKTSLDITISTLVTREKELAEMDEKLVQILEDRKELQTINTMYEQKFQEMSNQAELKVKEILRAQKELQAHKEQASSMKEDLEQNERDVTLLKGAEKKR